jgi:hypothetical protein
MYWAKKRREILPFLAGQIANIGHFEVKFLHVAMNRVVL